MWTHLQQLLSLVINEAQQTVKQGTIPKHLNKRNKTHYIERQAGINWLDLYIQMYITLNLMNHQLNIKVNGKTSIVFIFHLYSYYCYVLSPHPIAVHVIECGPYTIIDVHWYQLQLKSATHQKTPQHRT